MTEQLEISRDDAESRYVGRLAGEEAAEIIYRMRGDRVIFVHTGTEPDYRGRGLAAEITRYALDDVRDRGLRVVPRCPYTARFLAAHREYDDLVVS